MPILFCPHCANLLILSRMETGGNRVECRTCPYQHAIEETIYSRKNFPRKEKEDVFGGPKAWDNAQKIAIQCPTSNCDGSEAAYFSVQIRSADEPMTNFFKVGCHVPYILEKRGRELTGEVYDVRRSLEGGLRS